MKNNLIIILLFVFTFTIFSSESYAQRDAGGSASIYITQPCPVSFKRNNGNGWGVCHGDSQIRVTFSEMPGTAPTLTAIYYENQKTGERTTVQSVYLPVEGDFISKTKPYISYCLTGALPAPGNSQGNIPPASKLTLEFTYSSGQVCKLNVQE